MNEFSKYIIAFFLFLTFSNFAQRTKPRINENLVFYSQAYTNSKNTLVYFAIDKNELLTKKITSTDQFQVKAKIELAISSGGKTDTMSKTLIASPANGNLEYLLDSFELQPLNNNFQIEIIVYDLYKNEYHFTEKNYAPSSNFQELHFLKRSLNGIPIIQPVPAGTPFLLCSEKHLGKTIKTYIYNNDKPAPPPFISKSGSLNLASPDSVMLLSFSNTGTVQISLQKQETLIVVGAEFNPKDHYIVGQFDELYPYFHSYEDLIKPLKFLTSRDEYNEMMQAKDKRKAFESFWLKLAGSEDQATYLIKEFYQRVRYANKHFTSFKAGWQTDRGLLYLIYGEPEYIDQTDTEIKWTYGGKFENAGTTFIFYKSLNELTGDYELVRNSLFKSQWYVAMETWRSGNVYQK